MTSRTFTVAAADGALLRVQEHAAQPASRPRDGSSDAEHVPTVVLAHGWTLTRASWLPVVERLVAAGRAGRDLRPARPRRLQPAARRHVRCGCSATTSRRSSTSWRRTAGRPRRPLDGRHDRDGVCRAAPRRAQLPGGGGGAGVDQRRRPAEPVARRRGPGDGARRADAPDPGRPLRHAQGPAPAAVRRRPRPGAGAAHPRHGGGHLAADHGPLLRRPRASTTRARRSRRLDGIPTAGAGGRPRPAHARRGTHTGWPSWCRTRELRELPGRGHMLDVRGHRRGGRRVPAPCSTRPSPRPADRRAAGGCRTTSDRQAGVGGLSVELGRGSLVVGRSTPQPEAERRDGAERGCDGSAEEHGLHLHHPAASRAVVSVWSGRRGHGVVVAVQADRREQREPHDHADHPGHHDQGDGHPVGVVRGVGERRVVDRREGQPDAEADEDQDHRGASGPSRAPSPQPLITNRPTAASSSPTPLTPPRRRAGAATSRPARRPTGTATRKRTSTKAATVCESVRVSRASTGTSTITATSAAPTHRLTTRAVRARPRTTPRATSGSAAVWCRQR